MCVCVCMLLCLPLFFLQFFLAFLLLLIVHSETETTSEVAAVATNGRPSRNIKRPTHHDGTIINSVKKRKKSHAATAAAAVAAKEKKSTKKSEKKKAAVATKKVNDGKTADDERLQLEAKAVAEAEVKRQAEEERKRLSDAASAAAIQKVNDKKTADGKRLELEAAAKAGEEAQAEEEQTQVAYVADSANEKKIDNYFQKGDLKIGSKIDVYKDRTDSFIARTCVLKSVDEEGRTAQVVYEDGEDNEVVSLDLLQIDFDITLKDDGDDSACWILPTTITTNNDKKDSDGAASQAVQVALLKTIQEQMTALSEKLNEPNAKEKKSTEPKRAVGTRA